MAYTADDIVNWSQQFFPALRFSKGPGGENEAFYPIDVEGWLTQQAAASVVQPNAGAKHFRGSAVYRWRAASRTTSADEWRSQLPVIGAGQITLDAAAGTGIGNASYSSNPPADPNDPRSASSDGDWYIDFGGWCDAVDRDAGSVGYTWSQYQPDFTGLGLPASNRPTEPSPCPGADMSAPARFNPDATALHSYAEVGQLADIIAELMSTPPFPPELDDLNTGATALQGGASDLAQFIGITYYLLYPASIPSSAKIMEGDWEAITAFLSDPGGGALDLRFASYSQGYSGGIFPKPDAACKAKADLEMDGTHPVAYVGWGSHANYFTSLSSEVNTQSAGVNPAVPILYTIAGVLIIAGIVCAVIGGYAWIAAAACWLVALILIIIASIIAANQSSAPPPPFDQSPDGETNPHGGDGSTAGGANVGTPDTPPAAAQPVPFLVHPVSDIAGAVDQRCEPPAWWSYAGRWGVCVDDAAAMQPGASWRNATWRRMPNGYSLSHRNVEALLDYIHGSVDPKTHTSTTYNQKR
jgi:hypothetical protein